MKRHVICKAKYGGIPGRSQIYILLPGGTVHEQTGFQGRLHAEDLPRCTLSPPLPDHEATEVLLMVKWHRDYVDYQYTLP